MNNMVSKYKGGSSVVLPNPRDEDIFCYFNTNDERKSALIYNHDHSKDFHFRLKSTAKGIFVGCYVYPYMELLEGEDLKFDEFDVCDFKKEYARCLYNYIVAWQEKDLKNKYWYHIYLGYCALKNGKGKRFTDAQKEKAQSIHDKGITKTQLKNIFDYLTKIVNN